MRNIPMVSWFWTLTQEIRDGDKVVGTIVTEDIAATPTVMFSKEKTETLLAQTTGVYEVITYPNIVRISHGQ